MSKRAKTNHLSDGDHARYAARASAAVTDTEVDDLIRTITSESSNAKILRRLKNDDPHLSRLDLRSAQRFMQVGIQYSAERCSLGWLGYFVGKSTRLKRLTVDVQVGIDRGDIGQDELFAFFRGLNQNRSVQCLTILGLGRLGVEFPMLTQFFAENKNLNEIFMSAFNEYLNAGIKFQLSQALRSCTSLKCFTFKLKGIDEVDEGADEHVVEIINSLSKKSQLEQVGFERCLGRCGYRALADLLAWEGSQLQTLRVEDCHMDVKDFECLLIAVASNRALQNLYMDGCRGQGNDDQATLALTRAWGSIERPLLEAFASNLVRLDITRSGGSMDDEGAIAFSHALVGNRKLEILRANWERLTSRGWNAISKLLCDTSSPETTYASNHTLQDLGVCGWPRDAAIAASMSLQQSLGELNSLLSLNSNDDKAGVASAKILKSHDDFDMQVFFEWEFKMLPIAVRWLARAAALPSTDRNIQRRNLSLIYQFARGAPKSFVEYRLRGELEEIRAREERAEGEQERTRLEERKRAIHDRLRGE